MPKPGWLITSETFGDSPLFSPRNVVFINCFVGAQTSSWPLLLSTLFCSCSVLNGSAHVVNLSSWQCFCLGSPSLLPPGKKKHICLMGISQLWVFGGGNLRNAPDEHPEVWRHPDPAKCMAKRDYLTKFEFPFHSLLTQRYFKSKNIESRLKMVWCHPDPEKCMAKRDYLTKFEIPFHSLLT